MVGEQDLTPLRHRYLTAVFVTTPARLQTPDLATAAALAAAAASLTDLQEIL